MGVVGGEKFPAGVGPGEYESGRDDNESFSVLELESVPRAKEQNGGETPAFCSICVFQRFAMNHTSTKLKKQHF